jgi:uncharacterized RDD family membrane protein YckC
MTDDVPLTAPDLAAEGNGHVQDAAHRVHRRVTPPPPADGPVYIGLVTRAIAFSIDAAVVNLVAVLVAAASALIISVLPVGHGFKTVAAAVGAVLWVIWLIAYFASFWSATGQTPGNRAMQIRVVKADGSDMGFFGGVVRLGAICLAALPLLLGFAPILFNERRRGLQDVIAGTVVIDATEPVAPALSGPVSLPEVR